MTQREIKHATKEELLKRYNELEAKAAANAATDEDFDEWDLICDELLYERTGCEGGR